MNNIDSHLIMKRKQPLERRKIMTTNIDLGSVIDAHTDLIRTDKMLQTCDPKVIDEFFKLNIFLDENKKFKKTKEYEYIEKDILRVRNEFVKKCMTNKYKKLNGNNTKLEKINEERINIWLKA
jgi:hypothetical protein